MAEYPNTIIMDCTLGKPFKNFVFSIKKQSKKQTLHINTTLFKKFIVFIFLFRIDRYSNFMSGWWVYHPIYKSELNYTTKPFKPANIYKK